MFIDSKWNWNAARPTDNWSSGWFIVYHKTRNDKELFVEGKLILKYFIWYILIDYSTILLWQTTMLSGANKILLSCEAWKVILGTRPKLRDWLERRSKSKGVTHFLSKDLSYGRCSSICYPNGCMNFYPQLRFWPSWQFLKLNRRDASLQTDVLTKSSHSNTPPPHLFLSPTELSFDNIFLNVPRLAAPREASIKQHYVFNICL